MYAGEVGVPRLLKLFKKYNIKTTWFIPGRLHFLRENPRVQSSLWQDIVWRHSQSRWPQSETQGTRCELSSRSINSWELTCDKEGCTDTRMRWVTKVMFKISGLFSNSPRIPLRWHSSSKKTFLIIHTIYWLSLIMAFLQRVALLHGGKHLRRAHFFSLTRASNMVCCVFWHATLELQYWFLLASKIIRIWRMSACHSTRTIASPEVQQVLIVTVHSSCSSQAYYLRDQDQWTKIDYSARAHAWMKPLKRGEETGLVEIPANWWA